MEFLGPQVNDIGGHSHTTFIFQWECYLWRCSCLFKGRIAILPHESNLYLYLAMVNKCPKSSSGRGKCPLQLACFCKTQAVNIRHGEVLPQPRTTDREEIGFIARTKIQSHSQIFRYGQSLFFLPNQPDLCLHWVEASKQQSCLQLPFIAFFKDRIERSIEMLQWLTKF